MTDIKITSQMCATGSYLIHKGPPGGVQTVWHLTVNGKLVGTYPTRRAAREAADMPNN